MRGEHQVWVDADGEPILESVDMGEGRVAVTLTGEDGNVFNIIGLVSAALCDAGQDDVAAEFRARAFGAHSYDEVLSVVLEFCEVE